MSNNILITVCIDEEWVEILHNLVQKCDWNIRYMVGFPELEKLARSSFPGVIFEDVGVFLKGLECIGKEITESDEISALPEKPFEFELLEKLSKYEFMAKYIINRNYEKGSDRTNEIYFDLINYWLKIIDFTKPSLIIVPWTPYTSREYVLYALSQILGIKFLTFREITIGSYLIIPISNPHDPFFEEVISLYKDLKSNLSSPLQNKEYKIQKSVMQRIHEIRDITSNSILNDNEKKLKSSANLKRLDLIQDHCLSTLNIIQEKRNIQISKCYSNKPDKHSIIKFFLKSIRLFIRNFRNLIIALMIVEKLKKLKSIYDTYCVEPNYNQPYIFFPLHYQPEQTTAPFGNYSVYQYLPIEMIARSLPKDWVLYVKDHHATFSPISGGWRKRSKGYYERISKIPNVFLIPIEIQSAVLIDHSRAVATITGSAGFEGVLRGKPVLTFGSIWYNGCEGVFYIENQKMCQEVIEKIRIGLKIDPNQMLLFIHAAESVGAKVNYSFSMKNRGDESITREETIINMTKCISNWWDNATIT